MTRLDGPRVDQTCPGPAFLRLPVYATCAKSKDGLIIKQIVWL